MEHLEFISKDHFDEDYRRKCKSQAFALHRFLLGNRLDFLLEQHPEGFGDVLFPNIGYTYLISGQR
jgi:hypothetical protein